MTNQSSASLPTVEISTGDSPQLAIIWLHGLGADGHDFEPVAQELDLAFPVRFVFPDAPLRPITINGGLEMRGWYDILGFGAGMREDAGGIRASAAAIMRLIDREIERGLPASRIVLAGFSQGGAIALHTALREPRQLGGVLALSTYLPLGETVPAERNAANSAVPIFMAHGSADPLLPLALAERSRRTLEGLGYGVDWHVYPMPHSVCTEEIADIGAWLARRFA